MTRELSSSAARIRVLPELVINQIAAGEVIERPASVVKELVENALDAGATHVRIELEDGGAKLIRVTDDGIGMGERDLALAFQPHATSKLFDASDLEHIATLGFRGEALASIGSVARCRLFSRERGAALGAELENQGGNLSPIRSKGGPEGTQFEARDLFYNTPARRRFLKTASTELSRSVDVIQRLALAHEGVGFVLTHDGRRVYDVEAEMDAAARIRRTFGSELADHLQPIDAEWQGTSIGGFVAPPRFAKHDTSRQMWFLNGRPLRDKLLSRVLKEAYKGFLVEGRQPIAILSLALDPSRVDVNVHPAKAEVRFRDERVLFGFLLNVLREAVRRTDMATPGSALLASAERREFGRHSPNALQTHFLDRPSFVAEPRRESETFASDSRLSRDPIVRVEARELAPNADPALASEQLAHEPIGPVLQIHNTYLIRALEDGFEIADQHALHERITFEDLLAEVERGSVAVQRWLAPELVELTRAQTELVEEHRESFARLGLVLERFGPQTVAVHGLPARLKKPDVEGLVRDVLELVEQKGRAPDAREILEEVLHRTACRSSVMAGDPLDEAEIRELFRRGRAISSDQTCVHARPTRVRFTLADLEKAFHRR